MAFLKVDQGAAWVDEKQVRTGSAYWHHAGLLGFSHEDGNLTMIFSPGDGSNPITFPLREFGYFNLIDGQLVHSPFEEIMEAFGKPFSLLEDFRGDLSTRDCGIKVDDDKCLINGTGCLAIVAKNDRSYIHRLLKAEDCHPVKLCHLLYGVCFGFSLNDFREGAIWFDFVQAYWNRDMAGEWIAKAFVVDSWNRPHIDPVVELHLPLDVHDEPRAAYVLTSHDPQFQKAMQVRPLLRMVHTLCKRWGHEVVLGDRLSERQKRFVQVEQSGNVVGAARYLIDYYGLQSARCLSSPHRLLKESDEAISVLSPPRAPSFVPLGEIAERYRDFAALHSAHGGLLEQAVGRLLPETSLLAQQCYPSFYRFVDRQGLLYSDSFFDGSHSELLGPKEDFFRLDPEQLKYAPTLGGINNPLELPVKVYGFLESGLPTYMTREEKEVPTIWVRKPPLGERGYIVAISGYRKGVFLEPAHVLSLAVERGDNDDEVRVKAERPLHWQWDFVEFSPNGVVWRSRNIVCSEAI